MTRERLLVQTEHGIREWTAAEHVVAFTIFAVIVGVATAVVWVGMAVVGGPKR